MQQDELLTAVSLSHLNACRSLQVWVWQCLQEPDFRLLLWVVLWEFQDKVDGNTLQDAVRTGTDCRTGIHAGHIQGAGGEGGVARWGGRCSFSPEPSMMALKHQHGAELILKFHMLCWPVLLQCAGSCPDLC